MDAIYFLINLKFFAQSVLLEEFNYLTGEFKTSVGLVKIRVKNGHPARTKVLSSRIVKTRVILILDLKKFKIFLIM